MSTGCWIFPEKPPCFVLGGRFGDLIQLFPCFKAIFDRTKLKPVVICSSPYAPVFEGITYAKAYPMQLGWWEGVPKFKQVAAELFGGGIVVQFWQEPPKNEDTIGWEGRGWTVLQSHGHAHGVNMALDPDYGTSMARRCGFSREEWVNLPLVFDKRVQFREEQLVKNVFGGDKRPVLLYNLSGISSPFAFAAEILNPIMQQFGRYFHLVDLGKVSAHRIFDVLGLMDRAAGMVTCDTYSLHLALASKLPYLAFCVDGWTGSVPKGNCVWSCRYNESPRRVAEVLDVIGSWQKNNANGHPPVEQAAGIRS